ncbi:MAG: hypothetical protein LUB83_00625 [Prevotellaceae bacterium]|nr:hypothetical protein [Prevotellaceae bacterium]
MRLKLLVRSLSIGAMVFAICVGCQASNKKDLRHILTSQKESGYSKVMVDSIASIIFDSKKVSCSLPSASAADSLRVDTMACVPACVGNALVCILFNEQNFQRNDTVYGIFQPWATYEFRASKKRAVYLELDFSLRKWKLLDNNKQEICVQDTRFGNMELLYLTRLLFADDKTLNLLNENLNYTNK